MSRSWSVSVSRRRISCLIVRDRRDKPICPTTLRRHFEKELQTGATKLNAKVGHFMVATIFGTCPPDGVSPIRDERVRGRLGELFLKARLGWRDDVNQQRQEERPPRPRRRSLPSRVRWFESDSLLRGVR